GDWQGAADVSVGKDEHGVPPAVFFDPCSFRSAQPRMINPVGTPRSGTSVLKRGDHAGSRRPSLAKAILPSRLPRLGVAERQRRRVDGRASPEWHRKTARKARALYRGAELEAAVCSLPATFHENRAGKRFLRPGMKGSPIRRPPRKQKYALGQSH